jgi:MoaA/NifB/PqqE/SkfB family radical SAM enzyme
VQELDLKSIAKIATTCKPLRSLMISGGEPFLREDLHEIVSLFQKNAGIKYVSIPTNGVATNKIEFQLRRILHDLPETILLRLNISLDGFRDTHDNIRGRKGTYKDALKTIIMCKKLRSELNIFFEINITTVVTIKNIDELMEFSNFVQTLDINTHNCEIIRGESPCTEFNHNRDQLTNTFLEFSKKVCFNNNFWHYLCNPRQLLEAIVKYDQSLIKVKVLKKGGNWPFPCAAGQSTIVIEPNGDLRGCELREPVLNLNNYSFDIKTAMSSPEFKNEIDIIQKGKCFCTHGCFLVASHRLHRWDMLFKAPIRILLGYK